MTPDDLDTVPFLGNYRGIDEFLAAMNEWTEPFDELATTVKPARRPSKQPPPSSG